MRLQFKKYFCHDLTKTDTILKTVLPSPDVFSFPVQYIIGYQLSLIKTFY